MKERVIKDKKELTNLLLVCQSPKLIEKRFSVPNVPSAERDVFRLVYYGHTAMRQIYEEFEKKGAI